MILHFTHLKFLAPKYIMVGNIQGLIFLKEENPLEGYKLRIRVLFLLSLTKISVRQW